MKSRKKDAPWFNSYIKYLIRLRDRFSRICKQTGQERHTKKRNEYCTKSAVKEAKKRYFQHQVDCLSDKNLTIKKYWTIVHQIDGNKTNRNIPTLVNGNKSFTTDKEKAELLS